MTRIILLSLLAIALAACSTPPQRAAQTPELLPADGARGCQGRCRHGPRHDQRLSAQQGPWSIGRRPRSAGRGPSGGAGHGCGRQAELGRCREGAAGIGRVPRACRQPVGWLLHARGGVFRLARKPAARPRAARSQRDPDRDRHGLSRRIPSTRSIGRWSWRRTRGPDTARSTSAGMDAQAFRRYVNVTVRRSPFRYLDLGLSSMWLIRLYVRVLGQLGSDLRIGGMLALANVALAVSAFAEPILFGRIIDVLTRAQVPGTPRRDVHGPDAADHRLGGVRVLLHRRRRAGRALRGPALAPPAACRGGELFRARARTAAGLPHLDPFGPRAEGDARRLERHGVALARVLPRAFRRARRALHPAAPDGVPQLAARRCCSSGWSSSSPS